jgi:nucleotide-binding universal stress UspA family protein
MKPIVLAADGSPASLQATQEAISLAQALETPLVVVAVSHLEPPVRAYFGYAQEAARTQRHEDARLARVLAESAAAVKSAGIACEVVMASGAVADEICAVARRRDARLIVIGSHNRGHVGRAVNGSVSDRVLHAAPCPVLVVREHGNQDLRREAS